jgi:hypothetical protein
VRVITTLVLVGDTRSHDMIEALKERRWGRMFSTVRPTPYEGEPWAFDNGAYLYWKRGEPFNEVEFLERLAEASRLTSRPYLAVVPDIVACGCSSLQFSLGWIKRLRLYGEQSPRPSHPAWPSRWPWYLAVQDGMTIHDVEPHLEHFDGIFLGGTDQFKTRAWTWCRFAHDHGKRFHYGRAGTLPKMKSAVRMGADSLDSSFPLWDRDRFRIFWKQYDGVELQDQFPYMEKA